MVGGEGMSKQDRTFTRTAADAERKYNLGGAVEETHQHSEKLSQLNQLLSQYTTTVNAKISELQAGIEANAKSISSLLEKMYPVGAVYIGVNETEPSTLFGGEWELFAEGQIIVGTSDPESEGLMSVMQPYTTCYMWKRTA